jgi:hypothetical protein
MNKLNLLFILTLKLASSSYASTIIWGLNATSILNVDEMPHF